MSSGHHFIVSVYFIIFLHRTITFNSVPLKNTQTETQKYFLEFNFFSSTFWKITVGGFVNQLMKNFWPKCVLWPDCTVFHHSPHGLQR